MSNRANIARKVQDLLDQSNWTAAITEMEKLFAVDQDPQIRVRIGDVQRKRNMGEEAVKEYIRAAELFAAQGFLSKALAQYKLALRIDSSNEYARTQRMILQSCTIFFSRQTNAKKINWSPAAERICYSLSV